MHFILDALDTVSYLSMVMQKDAVTLVEKKDSLECTCLSLQAMVVRPGKKLSGFLETVGDGNLFNGVELNRRDGDIAAFNLLNAKIIGCMVTYLNTTCRFDNMGTDDVTAAFDIFNTSLWPERDYELALHGEQEVKTIVSHFKPLSSSDRNDLETQLVDQEWQELKFASKKSQGRYSVGCILCGRESLQNIQTDSLTCLC